MLTDVERVKVLAQYHEHASVLRIFFGDYSAEHIAIEPLRDLLVGDPQIDVTDAFQLNHCTLRGVSILRFKVMFVVHTPQSRPAQTENWPELLLSE
jgi:hypothetical protein